MKSSRRYLVAVALLGVLAIVFGLAGTVAPPLAEEAKPSESSSSSSSSSVAHFTNPPTYDSGWVDIRDKRGQHFSLEHNLNTTDVVVDITGRQSLDPMGGTLAWSKTYGGTLYTEANSLVQTSDEGYVIAGRTYSSGAGGSDFWLVKTDAFGSIQWNRTYGGTIDDSANSVVQTSDGGYALAGYTYSYGVGNGDFWLVKTDAAGTVMWNRTYGGANGDVAFSVLQTGDGGYALAGRTASYGAGGYDFWLVKTDSAGNAQWNRTYGGTSYEYAFSLVEMNGEGYALAGVTGSFGAGSYDMWLVKTDLTGNMLWNRTYGGTASDSARSLVQTSDRGYALAGNTGSYGPGAPTYANFWLVKTDSAGNAQWNRTYGGAGDDSAYSLVQTGDRGYALAGWNTSYGPSGFDALLVKTDSSGNLMWNRAYGGEGDDSAYSMVQTNDGGYALTGRTDSYGSSYDGWLIKVKPEMNLEHQRNLGGTGAIAGWSKTYGGTDLDYAYCLVQTGDGGYALAGSTESFGPGAPNNVNFWLVKTDSTGNKLWDKTYGGANSDIAYSLVQTSDGGYAIAGYTESYAAGASDFWLVKIDSAGNLQWNKTYGGTKGDTGFSVVQTIDGGYALAGGTTSYGVGGDAWLVKTDSVGNHQWNKSYGGIGNDLAFSLIQTNDGGYALAGYTNSSGAGDYDFWLVRTDSTGTLQWNKTYGGANEDSAWSVVQTSDGGYALAGFTNSSGTGSYDFWLIKTDSAGTVQWNKTYEGTGYDWPNSVIQTGDSGYALAGITASLDALAYDAWLVKTDSTGNKLWDKTYGGANYDAPYSLIQTSDGAYALAGVTASYGAAGGDFWLLKTDAELGLAETALTNHTITLYRGQTDPYWNYVRVRIWLIKEPTWIYGDINMDGVVDAKDLYIIGRNYGKTFSLLSLTGIITIAGIRTAKKRKQSKQPSYIS